MNELNNPIESIWVTISGGTNKSNIGVSVYYRPPNQGDDADDAFQKQTVELSKRHEIAVMGDFNYLDICWETNSAKHGSSRNS